MSCHILGIGLLSSKAQGTFGFIESENTPTFLLIGWLTSSPPEGPSSVTRRESASPGLQPASAFTSCVALDQSHLSGPQFLQLKSYQPAPRLRVREGSLTALRTTWGRYKVLSTWKGSLFYQFLQPNPILKE